MSRLQVFSEANGGGDRVYLDTLGRISSLKFSTYLPGGDLSASWSMDTSAALDHRACAPGRRVTVLVAGDTGWQGWMDSPQRGTPWQFTATGRASDGKRFQANAPAGNSLNLNDVIDSAIARGIGWTRPASLPAGAGAAVSASMSVDDALAAVGVEAHRYWQVARGALAVTMTALPTTVTYLLAAQDTAGGRVLSDYASDVYVIYVDATTKATVTILRSAASRPFGRVEANLDKSGDGPITLAAAQAAGDAFLAAQSARLKFAGAFTVTAGQLMTTGGQAVDLSTVQAGALMQVMLLDPDSSAGEPSAGPVSIVIGQTDYDVDADLLTITPLDVTKQ